MKVAYPAPWVKYSFFTLILISIISFTFSDNSKRTDLSTAEILACPISVTETSGITADDGIICVGDMATLTDDGTGTNYQWFIDNNPSGTFNAGDFDLGTNSTLNITGGVGFFITGSQTVHLTVDGSTCSQLITVNSLPQVDDFLITQDSFLTISGSGTTSTPVSNTIATSDIIYIDANETLDIQANVSGTGPFTYMWMDMGTGSESSSNYTLTGISTEEVTIETNGSVGIGNTIDLKVTVTDALGCSYTQENVSLVIECGIDATNVTHIDLSLSPDAQIPDVDAIMVQSCCQSGNNVCAIIKFKLHPDAQGLDLTLEDYSPSPCATALWFKEGSSTFDCSSQTGSGQSTCNPICLTNPGIEEVTALICKPGTQEFDLRFDLIASIPKFDVTDIVVTESCSENIVVNNVAPGSSVTWTSPVDDPNLDNLTCAPCTDLTSAPFLYDASTFGDLTGCPPETFTYTVNATIANSTCDLTGGVPPSGTVTVYPDFEVEIASVCSTPNLNLTASIVDPANNCSFDFAWSTGETTASIDVNSLLDATYTVTVTYAGVEMDCGEQVVDFVVSNTLVCPNPGFADIVLTTDLNLCTANHTLVDPEILIGCTSLSGTFISATHSELGLVVGKPTDWDEGEWTIVWEFNDGNGTIQCNQTLTVTDEEDPMITCPMNAIDLGCNPTPPTAGDAESVVATSDNCGVQSVVATPGPIMGTCNKTQIFNVVVTDVNGRVANCEVTYTWREDSQLPVISLATGDPDGTDLGCNPTVVPPTFTVSDNCDGLNIAVTDVQSSGPQSVDNGNPDCNDFTQTWNANYTDACTNDAVQVSVTYTVA